MQQSFSPAAQLAFLYTYWGRGVWHYAFRSLPERFPFLLPPSFHLGDPSQTRHLAAPMQSVVCPFPISPPRALFESPGQGSSGVCAWYDAAAHSRSAFFSKKEITKMKAFIVGVCRPVSCRFIEPKQCLSMCVMMMTTTSVCVCEGTSSLSLLVVWSCIKNSGASMSRKMWSC